MFEHDRSAARGEMASRRVIAFKRASALGNAQAHVLFDRVTVQRRFQGDLYALGDDRLDNAPPARRYEDYEVSVKRDCVAPSGSASGILLDFGLQSGPRRSHSGLRGRYPIAFLCDGRVDSGGAHARGDAL